MDFIYWYMLVYVITLILCWGIYHADFMYDFRDMYSSDIRRYKELELDTLFTSFVLSVLVAGAGPIGVLTTFYSCSWGKNGWRLWR